MLDRVAARQRAGPGEHRPLGIGRPLGVDLEDGAAVLGKAIAKRVPEARPLLGTVVQDGPARGIVQGQAARKASSKHGSGADRPATLDPEVALNTPAIARFEGAPGPGL